jgi:hypothetical protein
MKKVIGIALAAALLVSLLPAVALADPAPCDCSTGNGAPSGSHYTLNIIGVKYDKNDNMGNGSDNPNGNVIFVDLEGKNKINLVKNTDVGLDANDFAVLEKNATTTGPTGSGGAIIALPDPGLDPYIVGDKTGKDTMSDYSVFVRPLGKPSKGDELRFANITTCAEVIDSTIGGLLPNGTVKNMAADLGGVCSVEQVGQDVTLRSTGKSSFTNVTAELLTIVLKIEYESGGTIYTVYVRVPIFDPSIQDEYWEYDNYGLKHLQVRFYECSTDVSADDDDLPPLPPPYTP